jgi:hypothetical protein
MAHYLSRRLRDTEKREWGATRLRPIWLAL